MTGLASNTTYYIKAQATSTGGTTTAAQWVSFTTPVAVPPTNVLLPVISGTLVAGDTLTESGDTWSGTPTITYAYQWQDCNSSGVSCTNISGATSQTYVLQPGDVSHTIVVQVTGTNASGSSTASSSPSALVEPQTLPIVTTNAATSLGSSSAVVNGLLIRIITLLTISLIMA